MFINKSEINAKSSSLPVHPSDLHEWPEKNYAAYAWFWVLLAIALFALILIGIRIWLSGRQKHEGGCPCRKCKPRANKWIPIELKPIGKSAAENKSNTPNGLPRINEEDVEVLVESSLEDGFSEPRTSSSSPPPPPPGFKFNNGNRPENNSGRRNFYSRRNSLPSNLKNFYNQTKIGFEGLFHHKESYGGPSSTGSTG